MDQRQEMQREYLKNALSELSSTSGGSLARRIHKLELSGTSSVLFIGLGGLGSYTVNVIKRIYTTEFAPARNIRFMAVDTCKKDQEDITIGKENGYMENGELVQIFNKDAVKLLLAPPPEVQSWLGAIKPVAIDDKGAQQKRQIGRVMLCGTDQYGLIRSKINRTVDELLRLNIPLNVVIIAGLAGGTGSGTFIDMSYMVQSILRNKRELNKDVTQWGVFYTPSVQANEPDIAGNPTLWSTLQRNGYAAFKELDYYMNNGTLSLIGNLEPLYVLRAPGGVTETSFAPVFDAGRVFVISGSDAMQDKEPIVTSTARSLLNMFQSLNNTSGESVPSILSIYSNTLNGIDTWCNKKVGQPKSGKEKFKDPLGVENTTFPAFMNYIYSSFGYSSVYFPRDEMMAYCASEVLRRVIGRWRSAQMMNQGTVDRLIREAGLDSLQSIDEGVRRRLQIKSDDLLIDRERDAQYVPEMRRNILGFGHVESTDITTKEAKDRVDRKFTSCLEPKKLGEHIRQMADELISRISTQQFVSDKGPFGVVAVLGGIKEENSNRMLVRGAIELIRGFDLSAKRKEAEDDLKTKKANMDAAAARWERDHDPRDAEQDAFLAVCGEYSKAYQEFRFYNELLPRVIGGILQILGAYNQETFDIYVPVMNVLSETLSEDANFILRGKESVSGTRRTYTMEAYDLEKNEQTRKKFIDLFQGYISPQIVEGVSAQFAQSMFASPERRGFWARIVHNAGPNAPQVLADEIRRIFSRFFSPFVSDMLEKFAVLAYGDMSGGNALTPEQLNKIWYAQPGSSDALVRDNAINVAAGKIVNVLKGDGAVMIRLAGNQMAGELERHSYVFLLQGMDKLNDAIKAQLDPNKYSFGEVGPDSKSQIFSVNFADPVALPLVTGFSEYARHYFESEKTLETSAGRHLDERSQNWVKYLPELFGIDAQAYFSGAKMLQNMVEDRMLDNDRQMYDRIKAAVDLGLDKQYIFDEDEVDHCYKLICRIRPESDFAETFRQTCRELLSYKPDVSLAECLEKTSQEHHSVDYEILDLKTNNSVLASKRREKPLDKKKYSNLVRIVRRNMTYTREILGAEDAFRENKALEILEDERKRNERNKLNTAAADKYEKRLRLFARMLLCGLAEYDEAKSAWYYYEEKGAEPRVLFQIEVLHRGLEELLTLYFGFAGGMWKLDEEICSILEEECKKLFKERDFKQRPEIREQAERVLKHPQMTVKLPKWRDPDLCEMVEISEHRECYSVPKKYDGASSTYENLKQFYEDMLRRLDV